MSQGMCKAATASLGGGKYHAFNKLFKERKRAGSVGEGGSLQTEMEIWRLEDGDGPSPHKAQPGLGVVTSFFLPPFLAS